MVYPLMLAILNLRIVHECLGLLMMISTSELLQLLLTHVVKLLHSVCAERPSCAPMYHAPTIAESTAYIFHAVRPTVLLAKEVSVEWLVE